MISKLAREYGKASQRCEREGFREGRGEFFDARGGFLVGGHGG